MIEQILLDFLSDLLPEPVVFEKTTRSLPFVLLDKTGSGTAEHLTTSTFAIQSCAASLLDAAKLNQNVKALMLDFDALDEICSVKCQTDYNFTDTTTKQYRYQAVFEITHY